MARKSSKKSSKHEYRHVPHCSQQNSIQTKSLNIQHSDLNYKHLYTRSEPSNKIINKDEINKTNVSLVDEEIISVKLLIRQKLEKYKSERE